MRGAKGGLVGGSFVEIEGLGVALGFGQGIMIRSGFRIGIVRFFHCRCLFCKTNGTSFADYGDFNLSGVGHFVLDTACDFG